MYFYAIILGITDPYAAIYEFAGHAFNYVHFTHILFSIVFCGSLLRCCGEISENHALARRCRRYFSQYRCSRYYFAYSWPYAAALDAALVRARFRACRTRAMVLVYRAYEARFVKQDHKRKKIQATTATHSLQILIPPALLSSQPKGL